MNPTIKPRLDVHPFTDRGRREYQEDFFYTDPSTRDRRPWLGVVADGMGGHQGGDIASKAGVLALKAAFEAALAARLPCEQALVKAVTSGHEAVLEAARRTGALGNMGSTVVAFAIDGQALHWCSAGDSRLYLIRAGALQQLSRDFTLAEDMRKGVNTGAWTQEDVEHSPQRNALTSFMGTDDWRFHADSRRLQHGDILIACSDGVYGTIGSDGLMAACNGTDRALAAQQIAENLQRRVVEAGKVNQDNSTAVVVRFVASADDASNQRGGVPSLGRMLLLGGAVLMLAAASVAAVLLKWTPFERTAKAPPAAASAASEGDAARPPAASPARHGPSGAAGAAGKTSASVDQLRKELATIRTNFEKDRLKPNDVPGALANFDLQWKNDHTLADKERQEFQQQSSALHDDAWLKNVRGDIDRTKDLKAASADLRNLVQQRRPELTSLAVARRPEGQQLIDEADKLARQLDKPAAASEKPAVKKNANSHGTAAGANYGDGGAAPEAPAASAAAGAASKPADGTAGHVAPI